MNPPCLLTASIAENKTENLEETLGHSVECCPKSRASHSAEPPPPGDTPTSPPEPTLELPAADAVARVAAKFEQKMQKLFHYTNHKPAPTSTLALSSPTQDNVQYDWSKSTSVNYFSPDKSFFGPYASIRATLDYNYHNNYVRSRQVMQDQLITEALAEKWNSGPATSSTHNPWIAFTCGAMGAGKSHVVEWLRQQGYVSLSRHVHIDADIFRSRLPEWDNYTSRNFENAGLLTQSESGFCVEILQEAALCARRNIWIDGSLRNIDWYSKVFGDVRKRFPEYRLALFVIEASEAVVLKRARSRAQTTRRHIPEEEIIDSLAAFPRATAQLGPKTDLFARILNNECGKDPTLVQLHQNAQQCSIVQPLPSRSASRACSFHDLAMCFLDPELVAGEEVPCRVAPAKEVPCRVAPGKQAQIGSSRSSQAFRKSRHPDCLAHHETERGWGTECKAARRLSV